MKTMNINQIDWQNELSVVPDCVHQAILSANEKILTEHTPKKHRLKKKAFILLVATITLLSGMTAFAAFSAWQQRMQAMSEEEKIHHLEEIYASNYPFRESRKMSIEEIEREIELRRQYEEEGRFPEKELELISYEEYLSSGMDGVALDIEKNLWCLPERALTDEELLQIIDYSEKVDYSLQSFDEITHESIMEEQQVSIEQNRKSGSYDDLEYTVISYDGDLESMQGVIQANSKAIYVNTGKVIERIPIGESQGRLFYTSGENERIISYMINNDEQLYLSLMHKDADTGNRSGKLIKIDSSGEILVEYDLEHAYSSLGESLSDHYAYKMLTDDKGYLYLNTRNSSGSDLLFVFDQTGNLCGRVNCPGYCVNECADFFFGYDQKLYMMAYKGTMEDLDRKPVILKIDPDTYEIEKEMMINSDQMNYVADLIYQISEEEFIFVGWDGILKYNASTTETTALVNGYDEIWFSEGCTFSKIDRSQFVIRYRVGDCYEFALINLL